MSESRILEPPTPELRLFQVNDKGVELPLGTTEGAIELSSLLAVSFESERNILLDRFPVRSEGLNLDRVESFMSDLGLPIAPYTIVEETEARRLGEIVESFGYGETISDIEGRVIPQLGFGYAIRHRGLETHNGSSITEATLVHELGHLTGRTYMSLSDKNKEKTPQIVIQRLGMIVKHGETEDDMEVNSNEFYEEAFAELLAMRYVREVLGKKHGFGTTGAMNASNPDGERRLSRFPAEYLYKDKTGDWTFTVPAIAAAGMELLIKHSPELEGLLYAARTSVDAKRKFAQVVDKIHPGLYKFLGDLQYEANGYQFENGYTHIQKILGI